MKLILMSNGRTLVSGWPSTCQIWSMIHYKRLRKYVILTTLQPLKAQALFKIILFLFETFDRNFDQSNHPQM
jgi:hypothetical protein